MNVLIVYAHPEPFSLNGSIKNFTVERLRAAGHTVQVSDLYAMNWKPALDADDSLDGAATARFHAAVELVGARWSGAILPDDTAITLRILEAHNRPVSAVADQFEVRDVETVEIRLDRKRSLTLLFDPEHALDERIAMEQFLA